MHVFAVAGASMLVALWVLMAGGTFVGAEDAHKLQGAHGFAYYFSTGSPEGQVARLLQLH